MSDAQRHFFCEVVGAAVEDDALLKNAAADDDVSAATAAFGVWSEEAEVDVVSSGGRRTALATFLKVVPAWRTSTTKASLHSCCMGRARDAGAMTFTSFVCA